MNRIKFMTLTLLMLTLSFASCEKEEAILPILPASIEDESEMTKAMEKILINTEVPGFAIAMIKEGEIVYKNAFGYANINEGTPFSTSTQIYLASMSKTFVGAATVKAIEKGLFNINTPINDLLDFNVQNPHYPDSPILVKHLFTHTSGIIDLPELYFEENYAIHTDEDLSNSGAQFLMNAFKMKQKEQRPMNYLLSNYLFEDGSFYSGDNFLKAKPGNSWNYSNIGTGLMALIIEQQSGLAFAEFVKSEIFTPLNMNHSTYRLEEVDPYNLARLYFDKQSDFPLYTNDSYAEGGIYSSIHELSLYLKDMMDAVDGSGGALFPTDYYQLLFKNQLDSGVVPVDFADNHGVFWIKKDGKLMHGGTSFGVTTYIEINPATQQGYVVLCNLDSLIDSSEFESFYSLIQEAILKYNSKRLF